MTYKIRWIRKLNANLDGKNRVQWPVGGPWLCGMKYVTQLLFRGEFHFRHEIKIPGTWIEQIIMSECHIRFGRLLPCSFSAGYWYSLLNATPESKALLRGYEAHHCPLMIPWYGLIFFGGGSQPIFIQGQWGACGFWGIRGVVEKTCQHGEMFAGNHALCG